METLRKVLHGNVRRLMRQQPDRDNPRKVAEHAIWPPGNVKAGQTVSTRSLAYLSAPDGTEFSPSLDLVDALAVSLRVTPWALLAPDEAARIGAAWLELSPDNRDAVSRLIAALILQQNTKGAT